MIFNVSLVVVGAALMILGAWMLLRWMGDEGGESSGRFGRGHRSASQNDWVLMDLQFIASVIAPLLGGAILIVCGLVRLA